MYYSNVRPFLIHVLGLLVEVVDVFSEITAKTDGNGLSL